MRLLVVEDDPDLNRQLATALTDAGYVVDRAFDGEEGHFLGESEPYDAVILDIGLPKMDGISVLEAWRRAGRAMPVLILTRARPLERQGPGLRRRRRRLCREAFPSRGSAGAHPRACCVARRATPRASSIAAPVRLDTRTGRVTVDGNPVKLTSHEYRLLAYLMHHTGRVVSRTELVEHLYDQDFDRDSNTIEVFVGRIRKKLGVDVIQTVRGLGYLLAAPGDARLIRSPFALFFSATTWTVVILVVTGIVLSSLYRAAVERAFDRRLGVYLRTLVADVAAPEENVDKFPQSHRRAAVRSAALGLVLAGDAARRAYARCALVALAVGLQRCRSSPTSAFPAVPGGARQGYVDGPEGQQLRIVERTIDLGEEGRYLVAVAGDADEIDEETRSFDSALAHHLRRAGDRAAADHDLSGAFRPCAAQAHLGGTRRHPLGRRRSGSKARSRSRSRRSRARPTRLIDANREIVTRARTHVGNLAHALKTPISVMMNEASTHGGEPACLEGAASRPRSCAIRSRAISSVRVSRRASR